MPYTGYNYSNASDVGSLLIDAPNANTGDSFWVSIMWLLWIIAFALLTIFGWEVALLVASYGVTVIGVFLVYNDALAWQWLIPFAAIDLFMFFYIVWARR